MRRRTLLASSAALAALAFPVAAGADSKVTTGSPLTTFPQNKQNEPGLAIDQSNPTTLAAGSNDEIDLAACGTGLASNCPFTPGVGVSGIYFSPTSSLSFTQPTYTGFTARDRVTPDGGHAPGPIGTLPNYFEAGLASDGDPTLAFGPVPDSSGHFSYLNGSRLYYSNLTANMATVRTEQTFKGFEAIAVSHTDDLTAAAAGGDNSVWSAPAIVSQARQSSTTFSDKPTIWADNAESSKFFGRVYVCYTQFKSQQANGPAPIAISHSADGGNTWTRPMTLSASVNNKHGSGRQGCSVKTDSLGRVYVFWESTKSGSSVQMMDRSDDGGSKWETPRAIADVVDVGQPDPVSGDFVFDGIAGARTDSFPSVDLANGAPSGTDAPNTIAVVWSDARDGTGSEQARATFSTDRGNTWSTPRNIAESGDRPDFPAIALSPDGSHAYLTYDNFLQGFQQDLSSPRLMQGKVRVGTVTGSFSTKFTAPTGDARASSANALDGEFIGDYNWVVATNSFGVAAYNDVRNAAECPAVDTWRQALANGESPPQPSPATDCPSTFGNSDIYAAKVSP